MAVQPNKNLSIAIIFIAFLLLPLRSAYAMSKLACNEISGSIFYDSDTPDVENIPYTSGLVLAIKSTQWTELSKALHIDIEMNATNIQLPLSHELFDRYVAAVADLNDSGIYKLELDPGHYVFCSGNLGSQPSEPNLYRLVINGCSSQVNIQNCTHLLNFQFGESGFSILPSYR
jgi:hypothetical protein